VKSLKRTSLFIIILLLALAYAGISQTLYATTEIYDETKGLPNNEVRCLLKDTKGYLWVGTIYGLVKYDGNKFVVYNHETNTNSLSGDVITTVFEDNKGRILVGANGISILNRVNNKWTNYLHDPRNNQTISSPNVTSIAQENDSIYWIITSNGINRFNIETGIFEYINFPITSRVLNSKIYSIIPQTSVHFSIASQQYIYSIKNRQWAKSGAQCFSNHPFMFGNYMVGLVSSKPNQANLVSVSPDSLVKSVLLKNVDNNGLIFSKNGRLYLAAENKIFTFSKEQQLTHTIILKHEANNEYTCGLQEDNGTFWLGTTKGLIKVMPQSPFKLLDAKKGLPNEYIRSITIDSKRNLWIGVRQGAAYKISGIDKAINLSSPIIEEVKFPTPNGKTYATNQIIELQNGNLVFVTNESVFLYNTLRGKFTDEYSIPNNKQYFSAVEFDNGILVGSLERPTLFKLSIYNDKFERDPSFNTENQPDIVYSLYKDSQGLIWIGSEGLYLLNGDSKLNPEPIIPPINEVNYSNNSIWSIVEIDDNRLFIATTTNGFYVYNKKDDTYKHFGKSDGLSTDFTCTALADSQGNVWLSTKESLSYIDTKTFTIKNYPIKLGPLNSEFTFKCGATTNSNQILFGSKQGVVFFNPDSIEQKTHTAPLVINELRVFDKIVAREIMSDDTITLKHNQNFFSLEFSLLDFRNPAEVSYTYQLKNYDKQPRQPTNRFNTVSYTDVPPGKYTFSLTSKTPYSQEAEQSVEVSLIIIPSFYQTPLFKISVGAAIVIFLFALMLLFLNRRLLQGKLQKMELDLLRSQINPHFIFNTLTSIQQTILSSSKEEAVGVLSQFARLMRMFLDYSRLEDITLSEALHFYKTFVMVHSLNLDEPITFDVIIDDAIDEERIKISPMLIQPFLENSIVHGLSPKNSDMTLTIEIEQQEKWLMCTIADNGIGRKKAMEIKAKKAKAYKSVGIELSSKSILLQLKKGRFIEESFKIADNTDDYGNATGTTVYLKIPYKLT